MAKQIQSDFDRASYKRTEIYNGTEPPVRPKRLFETVADRLEAFWGQTPKLSLVDVGGASGDFAGYLADRFKDTCVSWLEFDPELVRIGKEKYPELRVIQGDANSMSCFKDREFHATTMVGVLPIFDDFKPSIDECIRVTRDGGIVIVVAQFNEYPVDALIRWRRSDHEGSHWNLGWNLFAKSSLEIFLRKNQRIEDFKFEKFVLPFDLAPQADPIRTWTERNPDGERRLRNGLLADVNLQILSIRLK